MLGGDHDVFHSRSLGQADPFVRIVLHRVELLGVRLYSATGIFPLFMIHSPMPHCRRNPAGTHTLPSG